MFQTNHDIELMFDRKRQGRQASPSAAVIDSQSNKAPHSQTRGYDTGKKIFGRKRDIAVGTDGRLLMVVLTTADISHSFGAQATFDPVRRHWSWVKHLFADATCDRWKLMTRLPTSSSRLRSFVAGTGRRASRFCLAAGENGLSAG